MAPGCCRNRRGNPPRPLDEGPIYPAGEPWKGIRHITVSRRRRAGMKLTTIGLALCAAALAGCAEKKAAPSPPPRMPPQATAPAPLPSGNVAQTVTATATVQRVDMKTRHVTLKTPDGKTFTIVAGPDVRNLKQVKKGDVLRVTYKESLAYQVNKAGSS